MYHSIREFYRPYWQAPWHIVLALAMLVVFPVSACLHSVINGGSYWPILGIAVTLGWWLWLFPRYFIEHHDRPDENGGYFRIVMPLRPRGPRPRHPRWSRR